ncbi:MAG: hypothetical protein ABSH16_08775 [Sedimentisphaerales bacterium]
MRSELCERSPARAGKKVMAITVMLVMSWVCSSSFGYLLLYNVSMTVNGADVNVSSRVTIPLKGYLLLNLDDSNAFVDANLMLYGRDADSKKKYVILDYNDGTGFLSANVWYIDKYAFVDLSGDTPFNFEIFLSGRTWLQNVGLGRDHKKSIAGSLAGVTTVRHLYMLGPDAHQDVSGSATVTATLWGPATKSVNGASGKQESWTQDEVISTGKDFDGVHYKSLTEQLKDKHFEAAALPPD